MSAFIGERRADFGVEPICRTLGVSASAYYERASGDRSTRELCDERLLALIREVHADDYEAYGAGGCGRSFTAAASASRAARCSG